MLTPLHDLTKVRPRMPLHLQSKLVLDFMPYKVSGTVYSVLLNDQRFVTELGEQAKQAPYKGVPRAPVLAVRPQSTWAADGDAIEVPAKTAESEAAESEAAESEAAESEAAESEASDAQTTELQTGACFGLVIKRDISFLAKTKANSALVLSDLIAGVCLANDCSLPIASHYRPAVRQKARDGFCVFAGVVLPFESMYQERSFALFVDGQLLQRQNGLLCNEHVQRSIEQMLMDITDFMTIKAGDILLLGPSFRSPVAKVGQTIELRSPQFGSIKNTVVAL
jgi:5-oxopent-3-ene-1,2,5-tricarboxylate decarboxylase / 2-hydroxyhepta-2,4-diene-1,7-dioate isomerase